MQCPKCKTELPDNGICPNCKQEEKAIKTKKESPKRNVDYQASSKDNMERNFREGKRTFIQTRTLIDVGIIMVVSIVITTVLAFVFTSYVDRTIAAIEDGSVEKAKDYYVGHIKQDKDEKAVLFEELDKYLEGVVESYNIDNINNAKAKELIGTVAASVNDYDTTLYSTQVEVLKSSKAAYEDGYTSSAKGEHIKAITKFEQVVNFDVNYDTAQSRIEYEKTKYKNEILDEIDEALSNGSEQYADSIINAKELTENSIFDNDIEFEEAYNELVSQYIDLLESQIASAKESNDYKGMYDITEEGISILGDNEILLSWKDEAQEAIIQDALYTAEVGISGNNYEDAAEALTDALNYCGPDPNITAKLKTMITDLAN